jgi:hypothetical protein
MSREAEVTIAALIGGAKFSATIRISVEKRVDSSQLLTPWQVMVVTGGLKPDETVLVHSAGGGVGIAAPQIAKHVCTKVYRRCAGGQAGRTAGAKRRSSDRS